MRLNAFNLASALGGVNRTVFSEGVLTKIIFIWNLPIAKLVYN